MDDLIRLRGECRVSQLAERFSVSHVTVTRTVGRLVRDGLAETAPRAPVTLTPAGTALAAACRARHAVVLRFLHALGVPDAVAQADAEGIEHHVSPETLAAMRRYTAAAKTGDAKTSAAKTGDAAETNAAAEAGC